MTDLVWTSFWKDVSNESTVQVASWKVFWVAPAVLGVVLEATWKPFWRCLKHLEFSKFKIGVTDLLWRSVLKDVSNEITVQVGSKEALGRVEDPLIPRRVSLDGEDQEG